jgi:uncharacterized Tic20 family protein
MSNSNLPPQGPAAGGPQQPYTPAAPAAPLTAAEDKQWASVAHFGGVAVLFWLGWVPPLITYLVFKDRGPRTNVESKESLNFQILVTAVLVINAIIGTILSIVTFGLWALIQLLIHWIVVIVAVVFSILGGVRVNAGGTYRYPVNVRLIK